MRKIEKITQTCSACPSQWEGEFTNGKPFYIRYRWGYLSVREGKKGGDVMSAVSGEEIFGEQLGDGMDGVIDLGTVLEKSKIKLKNKND